MGENEDYKWKTKDTCIAGVFAVIAIINIAVYIKTDGFSSIGELIEQLILIMLAFVGLLEIFHYVGWDVFVPGFMLHKKKREHMEELQECMDEVVKHSMNEVVVQAIDAYFDREVNFIKDFSEERAHYIMSQLGITVKQFEQLRIELIKMRCLPLANLNDAQEKIKQYIRCKEPFVADLSKIDSSKCTYTHVKYYLNFNDAMYVSSSCRELVSIMHLLISEKIGLSTFDKIVIPYDSNFILGVEIGKLLGKPVVHMRPNMGRIEKEKCWDGRLDPIDKVVIVHDVLVTSKQIIGTLDKLPSSCQIVGLCCFIVRKELDGMERLNSRRIRVERILDLDDRDIGQIM